MICLLYTIIYCFSQGYICLIYCLTKLNQQINEEYLYLCHGRTKPAVLLVYYQLHLGNRVSLVIEEMLMQGTFDVHAIAINNNYNEHCRYTIQLMCVTDSLWKINCFLYIHVQCIGSIILYPIIMIAVYVPQHLGDGI